MPTASKEDLTPKLIILTEQVASFVKSTEAITKDHEARLRFLETSNAELQTLIAKLDGNYSAQFATIKERQTISNIVQTTFATVAAVIAGVVKK